MVTVSSVDDTIPDDDGVWWLGELLNGPEYNWQ